MKFGENVKGKMKKIVEEIVKKRKKMNVKATCELCKLVMRNSKRSCG